MGRKNKKKAAKSKGGSAATGSNDTAAEPVVDVTEEGVEEESETKGKLISTKGDIIGISEGNIVDYTGQYDEVERARMLIAAMGTFAVIGNQNSVKLVIDEKDKIVVAKIKEGYDAYKEKIGAESSFLPYDEFWKKTSSIVKVWNQHISDGRGFVAFLSGEGRLVSNITVMPCHPHDALVFLVEKNHAYMSKDTKEKNAIVTDILDHLDTSDGAFVHENNRMFRALFINYRCAISRMLDMDDITHVDLMRWMSVGPKKGDEDDAPLQKKQLPKYNISILAKMLQCSENKAVRFLKGSGGDILGALVDGSSSKKDSPHKISSQKERIFQVKLRTTLYIKLCHEVLVSALCNRLACKLPPAYGREEEDIWFIADK